ncbi:MAG: exonuclease SbcCD subunit D, partial [Cyanobacteria bacterium]|nr:exonuclease SbcCD subunit D [Cyanobacteriota bacterium]
MRLLHTSDWHLGRSFHGASLLDEQAEVLDRIVDLAVDNAVDLVVIAGDLYDRAIPPAEAVQLFTATLARLRRADIAVVAIAGNHDSHVRVSVYDPLLSALGVTIRGDVGRLQEPVLVQPKDGGQVVAVYPLPYLEPSVHGPLLRQDGPEQQGALGTEAGTEAGAGGRLSHEGVTRWALEAIRRDLATRGGLRSVLVAHAFVAGGQTSDSERELSIGQLDRVRVDAFAGFDYVALGHLHGSQQLDGPRLAYSGTPLPYSFSEERQRKSVRLVHLAADGCPSVELVPLGVGRPLQTLEGPLEALCRDPAYEGARQARVRAILTDETLPLQAMARLRERFPHAVELRHQPPEVQRSSASQRSQTIRQARSPLELATSFFVDQQGREATPGEEALLGEALDKA